MWGFVTARYHVIADLCPGVRWSSAGLSVKLIIPRYTCPNPPTGLQDFSVTGVCLGIVEYLVSN